MKWWPAAERVRNRASSTARGGFSNTCVQVGEGRRLMVGMWMRYSWQQCSTGAGSTAFARLHPTKLTKATLALPAMPSLLPAAPSQKPALRLLLPSMPLDQCCAPVSSRRYSGFSAEQDSTAGSPAAACRATIAASVCSHGHLSSSLSGTPALIFARLAGGWRASPSMNGPPMRAASRAPTVLPVGKGGRTA